MAMKKLLQFFSLLFIVPMMTACPGNEKDIVPDETDNYEKFINAKFTTVGWDKDGHSKFNGSLPVKTAGGTGYVQYYAIGSGKSAIYYFPGTGAFAVNEAEMNTYDAAGQDKWGIVVSDPAGTTQEGCGYNVFQLSSDKSEAIITCNTKLEIKSRIFMDEICRHYKRV
jgi:hypothetical protein